MRDGWLAMGGLCKAGRARRAAVLRAPTALVLCVLLLAATIAAVVASGCGDEPGAASAPSPPATPRPGGTFRYPLQVDVNSLLPWRIRESPEVAHQIYEGLVAYETLEDGRVATVPCLAESWEANDDATAWTFHLRRGVRFQEPVGREVTAADVVAVHRFAALERNRAQAAYVNSVVRGTDDDGHVPPGRMDRLGVDAPDRYTVRFTLKRPFASFPDTLGGVAGWIWPVDYLERIGRRQFEDEPVGTGPFVVSRRVRGRYIDLARNPGWWNAASGRPYLETVHFVVFRSVAEALQAFQQGLLDYTLVPRGQVAASKSLPQVRSGEWVPVVAPRQITGYLCFNMRDKVIGGVSGLGARMAIDATIDRAALVDAVSDGVHIPQTGLVPPVFNGWDHEQPAESFDLALARRLYEEAGSPRLEVLYWEDRLGAAVAAYLQRSCAAAGITLSSRAVATDEWYSLFEGGTPPAAYLTAWMADYPGYDNFLYEPFLSSLSSVSLGTGYADPDVDRLLTLARSTADPAGHLDLSRRAAHEILADKPVLPLFEFADYGLLSARVGGFSVSPLYGVDAWKLWVK